ncbi:MAG: citramalate synthase [Clostridiales bacterium]|jgi:2-isopropylmalate synthase|nr:citramalate synthase [Clostridiales bacterium]
MKKTVTIFDSTLRDGAQAEGISFSVEDKLKIVKELDNLGVSYIEAGNPGSNPKDLEFFTRVRQLRLNHSKIAAFGSTRRRDITAAEDKNVESLLTADTQVVVIFGKSWDFHVTDIIKTTLDENLRMIEDTVAYLKSKNREVIFDAEHFFDGYKANPEYAVSTLLSAQKAGADSVCLCDTNGGAFPQEVFEITKLVTEKLSVPVGIHCHNDCGMAVANSVMAVAAGAVCVQGTLIGFGERCGNANLSTIIPNLQLKQNINCLPEGKIQLITGSARFVSEVANLGLSDREPYVGRSAFAHKGGMHVDGVSKSPASFEHIDPELVGNERKVLTSEVSGRSTILSKIKRISPQIEKDSPETEEIMSRLKELEHEGYQFEAAESAFELVIRKHLGKYKPFFELFDFRVIGEYPTAEQGASARATIKIMVDGKTEITAAEGDGPVNALDKALRKALEVFYPSLSEVHLTDYKVRVLDEKSATAAKVRVLIESSDGRESWSTVGVSTDIIQASWIALVDSIEYKLIKDIEHKFKAYL